ncbi:uncharacterized protein LOC128559465 [Mercenaria mercenaria]|uniref:uncharacterized protein LOC128559465 n=1 Tax=Mercenaria mercenaria TaxID=6596 RepID=UPI00234F9E90|nr:uncharacterized protein LOC128559465 [Mercenaria mercenaria]
MASAIKKFFSEKQNRLEGEGMVQRQAYSQQKRREREPKGLKQQNTANVRSQDTDRQNYERSNKISELESEFAEITTIPINIKAEADNVVKEKEYFQNAHLPSKKEIDELTERFQNGRCNQKVFQKQKRLEGEGMVQRQAYSHQKRREREPKGLNQQNTAIVDSQDTVRQNYEMSNKISELESEFAEITTMLINIRAEADNAVKEKEYFQNAHLRSKKEIDVLTERLRKLDGDKLRQGRLTVSDLSDPNRTTELGRRFSEIYDNEWTDAYEKMPLKKEEKRIGVLYGIVRSAFAFCQQKIDEQNRTIETIILGKGNEGQSERITSKNAKLMQPLNDLRTQLSAEAAENIAQDYTTNMLQVILSGFSIKPKDIHPAIQQYAFKCAEICWLLLVFNGQVSLYDDEEDVPFDLDAYKPYTRRLSDMEQPTVEFVVWPALCKKFGVLVKGVAQPKGGKRKPLDLQR